MMQDFKGLIWGVLFFLFVPLIIRLFYYYKRNKIVSEETTSVIKNPYNYRYYVFFFVIFLTAIGFVFLLPCLLVYSELVKNSLDVFVKLFLFIFILGSGTFYAFKKGASNWWVRKD